jgi:primosomal protein N' (replication factor Y)
LTIGEVAVAVNVDRTFDYFILPLFQGKAEVGKRVRVPFRGEVVEGFLVKIKERSEYSGRLHEILEIIDPQPIVDRNGLELAKWVSSRYLTPLGVVLKSFAPGKISSRGVKYVQLTDLRGALDGLDELPQKQAALVKALLALEGPLTEAELLGMVGCSKAPLEGLEAKGLIKIKRRWAKPQMDFHESAKEVTPSKEQVEAISSICRSLEGTRENFLLHGVNGSGKTEVYMQAVQRTIELGKQAIVVVPEISLTPQLLARFRSRFGEKIAVYHSGLSPSERTRQWRRIKEGKASVVIGVRAAIFAPFKNLGLIVIDEEHEPTYKQEDPAPRYHLREVALKRAEIEDAVVLMGSATPSLESYWQAQRGHFKLLELKERVVGRKEVKVRVVDMSSERGLFSLPLKEAISKRLQKGEQVILFLNRLGFSSCIICRRCRSSVKCPRCQIALVYHFKEQMLKCHYCGYRLRGIKCRCGSSDLKFFGAGTERVEIELKRLFSTSSLRRMDSEAVRRGEHGRILEEFRQGKIDILFGTQMIGMGLDFPNVTLVGIISADTLLDLPDFRAAERSFQLISQAAGRAGRGEKGGEVIIQTHHPQNYAVQFAANQDYKGFYNEEIKWRREFGYPPFAKLIKIFVEDYSREKAKKKAFALKKLLEGQEVLGPSEERRSGSGKYRLQLLLKLKEKMEIREILKQKGIKVDVDP